MDFFDKFLLFLSVLAFFFVILAVAEQIWYNRRREIARKLTEEFFRRKHH